MRPFHCPIVLRGAVQVNTTAIAVGFTVAYTLPFTACIEVKGALLLPTLCALVYGLTHCVYAHPLLCVVGVARHTHSLNWSCTTGLCYVVGVHAYIRIMQSGERVSIMLSSGVSINIRVCSC